MTRKFGLPAAGSYPWNQATYSFVGWVPNVSGHLSFGLICPSGKANVLNNRNDQTGERAIVLHSRRSAADFPLPGGLIGAFRRSATLDYVIAARTSKAATPYFDEKQLEEKGEASGVLTGAVYVLPRDSDQVASRSRDQLLDEIDEAIGNAVAAEDDVAVSAARALPETVRDLAARYRPRIACYQVNFALFRTGELRIWFNLGEFLGRDIAASPATDAEISAAEILPAQIYFCLKDFTHRHYHHDPETDQLLDLHRVLSGIGTVDDTTWRIDTLRGLAKVVVELRHSHAPTSNKKALGVLAYADAFQSLLARVKRQDRTELPMMTHSDVILYDFNHVRASIEALDALNESRRGALLQLFGILVGVILSAFALWAGAVQIQPILCDAMRATPTPCPKLTPNIAVDFINTVVANPLGFVLFLAILGFIAFIWFFKGITSVPGARRIRIWVNRFSSAIATSISHKAGDRIGFLVHLAIIGGLTGLTAGIAYWIVPKTQVPSVTETEPAKKGPWAGLDRLVGKKPAESGLFTSSIIAAQLRDLTGNDYDSFMALMNDTSALQGKDVLWVTGVANSPTRDGAYLIIDQNSQKLEVGMRREGITTVYRSPGTAVSRPSAVTQMLDGVSADVGPLAILAPVCKSSPATSKSRTLIFEGQLPTTQYCDFKITLRAGQVFSFSPNSARGLQIAIGAPGKQPAPITQSYTALVEGDHPVRVTWDTVGGSPDARAALRPFYVRAKIQ